MTMSLGRVLRNAAIGVLAVLWLVPTWLLVVNALVPAAHYSGSPHWLPEDFGLFDNMSQAWDKAHLGPALGNSLLYSVVSAVAAAVLAGFAAFATIVMPVKRQALWFWVIYSGTLLPLQVFIRPLFLSYAHTSLYDTQLGLVLIYTAIAV
ncbi:carbohydrate ABC transporter permease, partial [Streptomyces sp. SID6013]|nr:carbohydrate ABC transporter permease [Streptomyces sp. SID6013]